MQSLKQKKTIKAVKNIKNKVSKGVKNKITSIKQKRMLKKNKKNVKIERISLKQRLFFVPSLITCCSILCGLWAIFICFTTSNIEASIVLIIMAGLLDALDGRTARFLGVAGNFGIELDSLADFISFGIAPMIIYFYSFNWQDETIAFAILSMFPICMALRLARFNMLALEPIKDRIITNFRKNFFFGLAAPVGAIALLLPLITNIMGYWSFSCNNCALLYSFVISLFLVIPVPIFSHKMFHFGFKKLADKVFTIIVITFIVFLFYCPLCCILTTACLYASTIPFSIYFYNKEMYKLENQ